MPLIKAFAIARLKVSQADYPAMETDSAQYTSGWSESVTINPGDPLPASVLEAANLTIIDDIMGKVLKASGLV